jgi:hypothetical protein
MTFNIIKIILVFLIFSVFPILVTINPNNVLDIVLIISSYCWVYFGLLKPQFHNLLIRICSLYLKFKRHRLENKADVELNRRVKLKQYAITRQITREIYELESKINKNETNF